MGTLAFIAPVLELPWDRAAARRVGVLTGIRLVRFSLYRFAMRFLGGFPRSRDLVRLTTDFEWTGETGD